MFPSVDVAALMNAVCFCRDAESYVTGLKNCLTGSLFLFPFPFSSLVLSYSSLFLCHYPYSPLQCFRYPTLFFEVRGGAVC